MNESPPSEKEAVALARRVDQVCLRFEAGWKAGQRPRIEDYLGDAAAPEGAAFLPLLNELVALDIAYRRLAGETPRPEDYRGRFPQLDLTELTPAASAPPAMAQVPSPTLTLGKASPAGGPGASITPPETRLRCPHCHNPILLADDQSDEVLCPGCGSSFRVREARHTTTAAPMRQLGKFQLLDRVGVGAFGAVWRARDTELDRFVALKIPHSGSLTDEAELARFHREARASAQLRHPGIVTVHEVQTLEGLPTIVSDFIEGVPLKDFMEARRLTFPEAAALVAEVAEALDYAHGMGVVHRDIKPANIMLHFGPSRTGDGKPPAGRPEREAAGVGKPLVMDFGLALRGEAEITLTQDGSIIGTPAYMSPEQAAGKGHQADRRSDVYSLGVVLYELLCGELPFRGSKLMILHQVLHEEPRAPRRLNDKIPRDLETICLKAMAREPGRRYATARELADDLRRFLAGEPVQARPVGRLERAVKWVKRNPAVTAMAVAVAVALAVGTTVSYLKYLDAEAQRKEAEAQTKIAQGKEREAKAEAAKAEKAINYLVSIFKLADAKGQRGTKTARQILDDAEKGIPKEFADQPELRDKLLKQIGAVYDAITANAPLAMILEVSGTVQLHSTRDASQRAVPQALLYTGDRLSLGADAQVQLVILSDLHKERLRPGREVTVRRKGCEPADAVRERDQSPIWTFVRLRKGTFYMGGGGGKAGKKTPIKEDFEIAVHDVTQGQWEAVMGYNPSAFARVQGISDEERKLFPVEMVSWDDAREFIKKLNESEKKRGGGYVYRLPSEAEWEYACRGGATSEKECSYHFYFDKPTNDLSSDRANFNGNYPFGKAPQGKYLGRPTRVGAYPPNKLGLCDMHGNVFQWCADSWGSGRVSRGGSWNSNGTLCQAAIRRGYTPALRYHFIGFRLARVPVRPK